ncbi:sulfatase [Winogradskyella sp.]|uniref:sulfatase family protein n=1 Tax=Winogradskyella sp. TaxID=1883156 RepID=UPI003BA8680A
MMRIGFKIIGLLFVFALAKGCKQLPKEDHKTVIEKPNILWIVSEDNSPWIGAYGDALANTPNLDKLAKNGILFTSVYSNAPVCAPSRSTLITGMYANGLGTQHMRSTYSIPDSIRFYPEFLREAGYYTTNNVKKDYNTLDREQAWDESSKTATYKNRQEGQPFFHIQNLTISHESRLHRDSIPKTDVNAIKLYPYHPNTPELRKDYAVYYDRMHDLDTQIGDILTELKNEGLADDTIIFYYADHGGPVAGTKRFATQQGLNVPLIVYVPEKYQHLTTFINGSTVDHTIGFIDFPPTLMQLTGIDIPKQFQGKPFLNHESDKNLVFGFADRMDESTNMTRTVTDGDYRYTRNYFPQQPYGTHIQTLWKAPGMRSWHQEFLDGRTNEVQSAFFQPRPFEELYDIKNDPFQTKNLASDPGLSHVKKRLSKALHQWQIDIKDTGFIPEVMLQNLDEDGHAFTYTQSADYPIGAIIALVENVNKAPDKHRKDFLEVVVSSENTVIQFWAAQGLLRVDGLRTKELLTLQKSIHRVQPEIGIVFAETLFQNDEKEEAVEFLSKMLNSPKLMHRVQALNVLARMKTLPTTFNARLEEIGAKREGGKHAYDMRIANYLLHKNKLR